MTTPPTVPQGAFRLEAFQNPHLREGGDRVEAILRVTADAAVTTPARLLLGFVIDVSESMAGERIEAVRVAAETAIGLLDDGQDFFVVTFSDSAEVPVLPKAATPAAKEHATKAVRNLRADGGTAMSQGLAVARSVFTQAPDSIRQCIFLTDGKNESERPSEVDLELNRCAGMFTCNCWGVGTDWKVGEVQDIARTLLGKASLIPTPEGIESAFRDAVRAAQRKSVRDVRLRVWTPATAEVISFEQVSPTIEDVTASAEPLLGRVRQYRTGSWGAGEERDYRIRLRVKPGSVGDELLAARPSLLLRLDQDDVEVTSPAARVFARWTQDERLSVPLDPVVAHYHSEAQTALDIQEGLVASERGNLAVATELLGRAVRRANETSNAEMATRLEKVVDVVDAEKGEVTLKETVDPAATMDLQLESTTTRRAARKAKPGGERS
jgi:Mg-chelatase subunit ChlD